MAFLIERTSQRSRLVNCSTVIAYVDEGWGKHNLAQVDAALTKALRGPTWNPGKELYLIAFLWRDDSSEMVDL